MLRKILKELQTLNEHLEFFKKRIIKYDDACQKSGKASIGSNEPNLTCRSIRDLFGN